MSDLQARMKLTDEAVRRALEAEEESLFSNGEAACPGCGSKLLWGRASNGHLHVRCEKGCVEVMQ